MLDFHMKGLPIDVRQELFCYLRYDISETTIRWFLEKETDYPSFRSCSFLICITHRYTPTSSAMRAFTSSGRSVFELWPAPSIHASGRPDLFVHSRL